MALMFTSMTAYGQSNNENVLVEEVAPKEASSSAPDTLEDKSLAEGVRTADTKMDKELTKEERKALKAERAALKAERKEKKAERKAKKAAESAED